MKKLYFLLCVILVLWQCERHNPTAVIEEDLNSESVDLAKRGGTSSLKVMTWNVYVGTDVNKILLATDPNTIPSLVAEALQDVVDANFPERAKAIACQVAKYRPQIIALQEVSLLRTQSPGDAVIGGTTPAENVLFDYLELLQQALRAKGMLYRVAARVENADVELPMLTGTSPMTFDDVRLTDYDVILARCDIPTWGKKEVRYETHLAVPDFNLHVWRGYTSIKARLGNVIFKFVNTHLEQDNITDLFQLGQAQELITALAQDPTPTVLAGDLNTEPGDNTYNFFLGNGFVDLWPLNEVMTNNPEGFTVSHDGDLRNTSVHLDARIDYFMGLPGSISNFNVRATVIGDELRDRTPGGLWPSDHAGIVADIDID
ncbi:MAG: endonuclease/exonuclease/phosphatase family protein [Deferribacteres bacterium]|nr:endonuclease/exonuclease/phosphatase family protein [candidate division KSB1 bacterium]MCB9502423.1 endonuclease/exonuclease/phosphatase family protein [Deferribacteres bacterium]